MKLIIQIPCLNEADSLPAAVAGLPREMRGFTCVETLVIDDGSTDQTVEVARRLGVTHVYSLNGHQGLAKAFMAGLTKATEHNADVIVNIDADNQYDARDMESLVEPILTHNADMVIGARPIGSIGHFSPTKRFLQALGSRLIRMLSGADIRDAPSGFRAITHDAALRLNVFGDFTYTIETILQARLSNLRVMSVPVRVNGPTRPSRLFRSNSVYICRAIGAILNAFAIYRPMWVFFGSATIFLLLAGLLGVRYLLLMAAGEGPRHVQSVIVCAVLTLCGVFMVAIGILAHLQGINRRLLEEIRYLLRVQVGASNLKNDSAISPSETGPLTGMVYSAASAGDTRLEGR